VIVSRPFPFCQVIRLCRAILLLATMALCATAKAAEDESLSPLADPFGDGQVKNGAAPLRKGRLYGTGPQARRYAASADTAVTELAARQPRWQPFRWLAQETGWFTPSQPPPPRVISVVDMPATTPPASAGGGRSATWQGLSLTRPSPSNNIWLAYPVYLEKFAGAFLADEPIEHRLHHGIGFMAGLRTGWDYAEHWGVESRVAFARTQLGGPSLPTEAHENFVIWDAMWLYYPWANTTWRPFLLAGPGLTFVSFIDEHSTRLNQTFFHIPLGFGIKHRFGNQHAFRFDVVDNLLFDQIYPRQVLNQFSFVGGFEWRFGDPLPW
jgi:hypothetical protein